jgi:hypothetical protein
MSAATSPVLELAKRDVTVVRRDMIRARRATEIAKDLKPAFRRELLKKIKEANSAITNLIRVLNSGVLDQQSDDELASLMESLANIAIGGDMILESSEALKLDKSFSAAMQEMRAAVDHLVSIREGIQASQSDKFKEVLSRSVLSLQNELNHAA